MFSICFYNCRQVIRSLFTHSWVCHFLDCRKCANSIVKLDCLFNDTLWTCLSNYYSPCNVMVQFKMYTLLSYPNSDIRHLFAKTSMVDLSDFTRYFQNVVSLISLHLKFDRRPIWRAKCKQAPDSEKNQPTLKLNPSVNEGTRPRGKASLYLHLEDL